MTTLSRIKQFVNKYSGDIVLVIGVILISLLSFLIGYIVAREEMKPSLEFKEIQYEKVNEIKTSFPSAFLFNNKNLL